MQTQRRRSVMASLVLAAVMVLAAGVAMAVLAIGPNAATPAKTGGTEQAAGPNSGTITALSHVPSAPTAAIVTTSNNWAGFAETATAGTILEVFGEWLVPTVTCTGAPGGALVGTWVGIDGYGNGEVEQAGTSASCSGAGATPVYYDWWEFYPYNSAVNKYHVSPGDFMQVYILYNPYVTVNGHRGIYTLVVSDLNHYGDSFSVTGNPSTCNAKGACETGPDASAECISEKASSYLANYGTTTFLSCDSTIGSTFSGIGGHGSHVTLYRINQVGPVTTLTDQSTSGLSTYDYTDDHFTITWHHYH